MSDLAFGLAEIEEDERVIPISNSHLSWGRCSCGARALFDPASVPVASVRCGGCLLAAAQTVTELPPAPAGWERVPALGQGYSPAPPAGRVPYPAPETSSRDPWDGADVPRAVASLAKKARGLGWRVKAQRSRGCLSHLTTGAPGEVRDLWGLIFTTADGGASAYAIRDEKTWIGVMLWGAELPWFPGANVSALEQYLAAQGHMPAEWYDAIRSKAAGSSARAKLRAACNRGVHETVHDLTFPGPLVRVTQCEICSHGWITGANPWRASNRAREGLS